ncbi:hypothetical protein MUK42_06951 [Musa troglodytarum]|uniref:Uncharacterized protein n=1 Tax=Musa troglodytarum TaxID=320322 RepID=A0A9E7HAF6_9LILI|nr:hypothetical protein MUK42_06951 [Musa troglodytarum]
MIWRSFPAMNSRVGRWPAPPPTVPCAWRASRWVTGAGCFLLAGTASMRSVWTPGC